MLQYFLAGLAVHGMYPAGSISLSLCASGLHTTTIAKFACNSCGFSSSSVIFYIMVDFKYMTWWSLETRNPKDTGCSSLLKGLSTTSKRCWTDSRCGHGVFFLEGAGAAIEVDMVGVSRWRTVGDDWHTGHNCSAFGWHWHYPVSLEWS